MACLAMRGGVMKVGDLVILKGDPRRLGVVVVAKSRHTGRSKPELIIEAYWSPDQKVWSFRAEDLEVLCK